MEQPLFPSYMQMKPRVRRRVWDALRIASVVAALALCISLLISSRVGLFLFWGLLIPLLPLLFFVAPGLWRNVCPLAASNQTPRRFGFTAAPQPPPVVREYGYVIAIALFFVLVPARKVLFNTNGAALGDRCCSARWRPRSPAASSSRARAAGAARSARCCRCSASTGRRRSLSFGNSHCEPCVGCAKNCYDFNPRVALPGRPQRPRPLLGRLPQALRRRASPALVLAFFTVHVGSGWRRSRRCTGSLRALHARRASAPFFLLDALLRVSSARDRGRLRRRRARPLLLVRLADLRAPGRPHLLGVARVARPRDRARAERGLDRAHAAKERAFLEEADAPQAVRLGAGGEAALDEAPRARRPEVTIVPDEQRVVVGPGLDAARDRRAARAADRGRLPDGHVRRRPGRVVSGGEHLSPICDDERATLERLGLADTPAWPAAARIAGPVSVSLTPQHAELSGGRPEPGLTGRSTRSIARVVVIGNGIAGVTAADHVRRRHPACEIDLVAASATTSTTAWGSRA